MKHQKSAANVARMFFASLLFCTASGLIVHGVLTPSIAQSEEERELEDKIPKHVPIKIKLRAEKEKAFKDLNNPNWDRDFELEVTNTSSKPIYFLRLAFLMPEVIWANGLPAGISLYYGRPEFVDFNVRPNPDDVPIQPGATYTFKLPDDFQRVWQARKAQEHRPDPKKTEILFAQLSFADGTGFDGMNGEPFPFKRKQSTVGLFVVFGQGKETILIREWRLRSYVAE